ncbi:MAG: methyltransferase domain-containing protein [Chloroflexota bacterium]|nr:methyltransferase domain-containing protein [Chloroflexota bacterium]
MKPNDFLKISANYEKDSLVQKSASDELFDLLDIKEANNVLDLGCGTGHLTKAIREITTGKVVGIDGAEGMIEEAERNYKHLDISFEARPAADLRYPELFDVIFCNSAFQWFNPPDPALRSCFAALWNGGRMGIQAPATKMYSPNFIQAVGNVKAAPETSKTLAHFKEPWFFRETAEEYQSLFESLGFEVAHSRIDRIATSHTPDEVFKVFDSGAAAGYLNQSYYSIPISETYIESFREIVRKSFIAQANSEGKVDLVFFRIYLLARKP